MANKTLATPEQAFQFYRETRTIQRVQAKFKAVNIGVSRDTLAEWRDAEGWDARIQELEAVVPAVITTAGGLDQTLTRLEDMASKIAAVVLAKLDTIPVTDVKELVALAGAAASTAAAVSNIHKARADAVAALSAPRDPADARLIPGAAIDVTPLKDVLAKYRGEPTA
jgi:hypothetical protein